MTLTPILSLGIGSLAMARHSDDPVRYIVTFRVNSEEKRLLEHLAKQAGRTLSDFMRHNLPLNNEDKSLCG